MLKRNRDGFILIDSLISIFIVIGIIFIVLNFYIISVKSNEIIDKIIEEYSWTKENTLKNLNGCVIEKKDISYQEQ